MRNFDSLMKIDRTYIFVTLSSIALLLVLAIQVNYLLNTAQIKEQLFNEKANMVLDRTALALSNDTATIKNFSLMGSENETKKIDSLFNHFLKIYNFHIDYYFELKTISAANSLQIPNVSSKSEKPVEDLKIGTIKNTNEEEAGCYQTCLPAEGGGDKMELKLVLPDKAQFIRAEMGVPFITSVLLILLVLVMSWRTIMSLLKEKKISEHTTDFLNNMTHEFKTPLTNIALAGRMMLRENNVAREEKIKHYSGIILEENDKLRLQVEQVLSMTALERGEIPLQKKELDLHELISHSLKCMGLQIEHNDGNVNIQLDAEHFEIMGDKNHLTNSLCNLVDNAIKYSGNKLELSVRTYNAGTNLVVIVSDKGIGIDKEYQKKVFEKFFRVPTGDIHDVKGFGLGLAYVQKIIQMHDGNIELQSKKGEGTTFTITLPYV